MKTTVFITVTSIVRIVKIAADLVRRKVSVVDDFAIADRDFPKDAIDGDPPPVDVDLPAFAEVPSPDQTGRIHLQAAEREVMPPDLRRDGLNDVHTGSFVRRSAR